MPNDLIIYNGQGSVEDFAPGRIMTSYADGSVESRLALFRAVQGSDFALDNLEGETIEVEHVVAHHAPLTDTETGEVSESIRTVLIGPDGARYSTRSATVQSDIRRAAEIMGLPLPWKPALRFRVVRQPNRNKTRKYLQLELVGVGP